MRRADKYSLEVGSMKGVAGDRCVPSTFKWIISRKDVAECRRWSGCDGNGRTCEVVAAAAGPAWPD